MDPICGNSFSGADFAVRMRQIYERKLKTHEEEGEAFRPIDHQRTSGEAGQRNRKRKEACLKFEEHFQRVEALQLTSNPTYMDILRIISASYYGDLL